MFGFLGHELAMLFTRFIVTRIVLYQNYTYITISIEKRAIQKN